MSYWDSSDQELTSYSEDERYAKYRLEVQKKKLIEQERRKRKYEEILKTKDYVIFCLQGLTVMTFTDQKIKFCYQPSLLYHYISKKLLFYCTLRYLKRYQKWRISKEPMPARPLFSKVTSKSILIEDDLTTIGKVIIKIYEELRKWSENEIKYRRTKYERYQAGHLSYLDIDSTDEELYFSKDECKALFEKRQTVLKRMIPPAPTQLSNQPKQKTKLKYKI